ALNLARDISESVTHAKMLARSQAATSLDSDEAKGTYLTALQPELERLVLLSGIYEAASFVDRDGVEQIRIDQRSAARPSAPPSAQPPRHLGNERCVEQTLQLTRNEAFIT